MYTGEITYYAAANNANVKITTKTNNASFHFSWKFIDVTTFNKIQNPSGTILNLNLTANTFYQFNSELSNITFHTANLDRTFDVSLAYIYVYDGQDLNGKFLGHLLQFSGSMKTQSTTGKSLVLVNFYGSNSRSYGIANDYSSVFSYNTYELIVASSGINYYSNYVVPTGKESAFTYFCVDSMETYIIDLNIVDQNVVGQSISFKPLTPTQFQSNLLIYK